MPSKQLVARASSFSMPQFLCMVWGAGVIALLVGVLAVGCVSSSTPVQAESSDNLKRLRVVEGGAIDGTFNPWVYVVEDVETGEHYALACKGTSVAWVKLSK